MQPSITQSRFQTDVTCREYKVNLSRSLMGTRDKRRL